MSDSNFFKVNDISIIAYPDEIILKKCYAGEADGWDMLVEKYYRLIYNKIHNTLFIINYDDASVVDDIYQDVFVKLIKIFNNKTRIEFLKAFIVRTSYTTTIDYIRKNFKEKKIETLDDDERPIEIEENKEYSPEEIVISQELKSKISAGLSELASNEQIILKLFYFYGKKYDEIAEILNSTTGSIGGIKSNAEKKLYKILTGKQISKNDYLTMAFLLLHFFAKNL